MIKSNICIVGFGSMGKMIVEGFINQKSIKPKNIYILTRSEEKSESILAVNKNINILIDDFESTQKCKVIILCVPPTEIIETLKKIKIYYSSQIIVSIASIVSIKKMSNIISGPICRIIPSYVSEIYEGIFLYCKNKYITETHYKLIQLLFNKIGKIKEINENNIETCTELTSCAPGIFASVFSEFIKSALLHDNLDPLFTRQIFIQTMYGLTKLIIEKELDFEEVISRVARKGGMTEIGVNEIRNRIPEVYNSIFDKTIQRYKEKNEYIENTV